MQQEGNMQILRTNNVHKTIRASFFKFKYKKKSSFGNIHDEYKNNF